MCVILSILALVACEVRLDNTVGYVKNLDFPADKVCFTTIFEELKAGTPYKLSVITDEKNGKITTYELTIDGQAIRHDSNIFVPASFQLSKEFLSNVQQSCIDPNNT